MAFRRSMTARASFLYHQQRVAVPFSHIDRNNGDRENLPRHNAIYNGTDILHPFVAGPNLGSFYGSRNPFRDRRFAIPATVRKMSTAPGVLGETAAQVAPVADSSSPMAAIQYMIDYVHTFTGLNWWTSIVVTTVLFRTLILPFTIHHTKSASKFTLIRPQLEEIVKQVKSKGMTPAAVHEGRVQKSKLYDTYGVTPFTPLKGILVGGPVFFCFCFAINNMAQNVQSFKEGGAFWFTDLTTPDAMYILPVLTALTFCKTVEHNAQQGLEGDPTAKDSSRVIAVLSIPIIAQFPKAMFCYWITSNLYTIAYELVIKKPKVKLILGIPDLPPPSTNQEPSPSFSELLNYVVQQLQLIGLFPPTPEQSRSPPPEQSLSPPPANESSKPVNRKLNSVPSSALSQRIKNLDKEVKGRKKGNKRSFG
ncbi:mitochondrial inner membrane protein OXA1-like [Salvia splendens]|uniref:mitochondrial inner membrane protein OXA1-like n=1 Tax=Salvia splendens TaxID=180675 RepID=UPI001102AB05|nr:mitochondrial inner membrane protein OXA1-like [Salvia splendens]